MSWLCPRCDVPYVDRSTSCSDCGAPLVEDLRGTVLAGRYRLESILGTGAQDSTVWKAFQVSFERPVAVKLMPGGDNTAQDRFKRGAKIASRLNHQNITTVHDYGRTDDGKVYLVMELLQGRTLREELRRGEPMPVDRAVHVASQVLRALEEAHDHSVVHRDLKPDNLFLVERAGDPDFVKVLDFGIAKFFAEPPPGEQPADDTIDGAITRGWQLCGTPLYMAPEQISGEAVGAHTDIYALGVVLYQMLLGRVPFRAKTQYAVLSQHLRDPPPAFAAVRPDVPIPEALERVVMKALSKDRMERYESARDMRYALKDVQAVIGLRVEATDESDRTGVRVGRPVTMVQTQAGPPPPQPSRRTLLMLLLVLFAMAVGAGIAVFAISETRGSRGPQAAAATAEVVQDTPATEAAAKQKPAPVPVAPPTGAGAIVGAEEDAPTAPAAPGTMTLQLDSTPSGATVHNGRKLVGTTPFDLELPRTGAVRLTLTLDGYEKQAFSFDPTAHELGETASRVETLKPLEGAGGEATVEAAPAATPATDAGSGGGDAGSKSKVSKRKKKSKKGGSSGEKKAASSSGGAKAGGDAAGSGGSAKAKPESAAAGAGDEPKAASKEPAKSKSAKVKVLGAEDSGKAPAKAGGTTKPAPKIQVLGDDGGLAPVKPKKTVKPAPKVKVKVLGE